ncbi:phenylalanine-4-hydroxylase [Pseudomonas aeruginosa]|nr:phenylalanine-4-hydroxylase [Pseudomonas aeruginosa]
MFLARLYWMTIEFGLVDTDQGKRIYGGGILSSPKETVYSLSDEPLHQAFNPLEAMRTPYRIDILQPLTSSCPTSSACSSWPRKTSWRWSTRPCAWACTRRCSRPGRRLDENRRRRG